MSKIRKSTTVKRRKDDYAYREKLPFIPRGRSGVSNGWWHVRPSGKFETDYETGQAYAAAFWRVSGGRPICGIEVGQILLAMHDPARRRSDRPDGLSGIEVGFIRTIGDIVDITTGTAVLAALDPNLLASGKAEVTNRKVRAAAKIAQILLDGKLKRDRKAAAESAKSAA